MIRSVIVFKSHLRVLCASVVNACKRRAVNYENGFAAQPVYFAIGILLFLTETDRPQAVAIEERDVERSVGNIPGDDAGVGADLIPLIDAATAQIGNAFAHKASGTIKTSIVMGDTG